MIDENKPCQLDHNGECLICDCWQSDCAWDRLQSGDFKHETFEQLLLMFKDRLSEQDITNLRIKHES